MKNLILFFTLTLSSLAYSQAPEGINYQAVIRNSSGNLVTNTSIANRIQIRNTPLSNEPLVKSG
jgi:hypothetical protein